MPKIHVKFEYADMEHARFTFAPGDGLAVSVDGAHAAARDWADGADDPGVTVSQAEVLRDLADVGITLEIGEDGKVSIVEI